MAYSKRSDGGTDLVLIVVNLDPYGAQSATLDLDMAALGAPAGTSLEVHDELSGETYTWGQRPYVMLDPFRRVAHIFDVRWAR